MDELQPMHGRRLNDSKSNHSSPYPNQSSGSARRFLRILTPVSAVNHVPKKYCWASIQEGLGKDDIVWLLAGLQEHNSAMTKHMCGEPDWN